MTVQIAPYSKSDLTDFVTTKENASIPSKKPLLGEKTMIAELGHKFLSFFSYLHFSQHFLHMFFCPEGKMKVDQSNEISKELC